MKRLMLIVLIFLAGCTTAYGPYSLGGGYKQKQLDEDSYIVSFIGNGYTGEQQVWNYWMYRCAELTLENGYTFFSLEHSDKYAFLFNPGTQSPVQFRMLDAPSDGIQPVQYYYTTVTTYSSKAIVNMYKLPLPESMDMDMLLDAAFIQDQLKPYVDSKAKAAPPNRQDLLVRAAVEAIIKAKALEGEEAEQLRSL